MKTENYIMLKADEGKVLTNGEVYGKVIVLGNGDKVENYHEITDEEYEKILKQEEMLLNGDFIENQQ